MHARMHARRHATMVNDREFEGERVIITPDATTEGPPTVRINSPREQKNAPRAAGFVGAKRKNGQRVFLRQQESNPPVLGQ